MVYQNPVQHCPGCGQALRFPENVGGVVMACPNCGHRFASTFKLANTPRPARYSDVPTPPDPPLTSVITPPATASPASPPATTTLAARVAALYASKA